MLPMFQTTDPRSAGAEGAAPPWCRPVVGAVKFARFDPEFAVPAIASTEARRQGIRYERRVVEALLRSFAEFRAAPAIRFIDKLGARVAVPDGLLVTSRRVYVIEIKLQHTTDAWWQLRRLYAPIVARLFPTRELTLVEICSRYDPNVVFPEPFSVSDTLDEALTSTVDFVVCVHR